MIRIATEADVPVILDIYAPYILSSTVMFEYDVPCKRSLLQRFYETTAQFPWLVSEGNGEIQGYAHGGRAMNFRLNFPPVDLNSTGGWA